MGKKRSRARTQTMSAFRAIGEGTNVMFDAALHGLFSRIRDETDELFSGLESRAMEFRKRFMRKMFASVLIGTGAMFLFVALLLYLVQIFEITWATALLIVGIVILAIAFFINVQSRR
jgi:hypothetical protein